MSDHVADLLLRCGTKTAVLPPTALYNEGWLLRLVLDWFERKCTEKHTFAIQPGARWFSEALLPSRFLPTRRGDPLAESFTHADGVLGHFDISPGERGEVTVRGDAKQFIVIEAKLGSRLSKGVKNSENYGQAARNVACIAHAIHVAGLRPNTLHSLGFYVVAPEQQIRSGVFEDFVTKERISSQVKARVCQYEGKHDSWFKKSFLPTLASMEVKLLSWESIIAYIEERDPNFGLYQFYGKCLEFNHLRGRFAV